MTKRAIASFEVVEVRSAPRRTRNLKVKKKEGSEIGLKKEAGGKSRKPNLPRSWDDKASRAIRLKLAGFPLQQVRRNENSKGQTIHPMFVEAMQSLGGANENTSLVFWEQVIKDFELRGGYAEDIPKPASAEHVNKELNAGLAQAHSPNPATRSAGRLTRYLEYAKPMNET